MNTPHMQVNKVNIIFFEVYATFELGFLIYGTMLFKSDAKYSICVDNVFFNTL